MQRRTRRDVLRTAAGAAAVGGIAGCLGGSRESVAALDAPAGTKVVEVGPDADYEFVPGTGEPARVSPGTTVRFVWLSNVHNVAVTSQPAAADWQGHEEIQSRGFSFEYTFDVPGRYEYVCQPHANEGMRGTLVVEERG